MVQRHGSSDPTANLASVVEYVLRAASGIAEAELNDQGSAKPGHSGFSVSQNSEQRTVLVEALGFSQVTERQFLARYKRTIGNALTATLGVNTEQHVQIDPRGMVRVHSLSDEQIAALKRRYSH